MPTFYWNLYSLPSHHSLYASIPQFSFLAEFSCSFIVFNSSILSSDKYENFLLSAFFKVNLNHAIPFFLKFTLKNNKINICSVNNFHGKWFHVSKNTFIYEEALTQKFELTFSASNFFVFRYTLHHINI